MSQLTILNPDNSLAEAFFISQSLYDELATIAAVFELTKINLNILQAIQVRVLSTCSKQINTIEPSLVFQVASQSFDWFDELLALIAAVEKLPNSHSLSISFD